MAKFFEGLIDAAIGSLDEIINLLLIFSVFEFGAYKIFSIENELVVDLANFRHHLFEIVLGLQQQDVLDRVQ